MLFDYKSVLSEIEKSASFWGGLIFLWTKHRFADKIQTDFNYYKNEK